MMAVTAYPAIDAHPAAPRSSQLTPQQLQQLLLARRSAECERDELLSANSTASDSSSSSSSPCRIDDKHSKDTCTRRSWPRRFSLTRVRNRRSSSDSEAAECADAPTSPLSPEAEALKQQILRKWPKPLFRFRLHKMRYGVVSPVVTVPFELAHPRARTSTVSGIRIPLTRAMFDKQRQRLVARMSSAIDEVAAL